MFKDFNIAQIGHPILRKKTKEVPINDIKSKNIQEIIAKMINIMRRYNGAGLAANQIYEPLRICIIEVLDNPRYKHLNTIPLKVLINPKVIIKKNSATFNSYEGCLSVPNLRGKVKRYNTINVTYYTMDAKKITEDIIIKINKLKDENFKISGQNILDILTVNGIRFTLEDGSWGLIRASSNKPSLVVVTESPTSDEIKKEIFHFIDKLLQETGKIGDYDQKIN